MEDEELELAVSEEEEEGLEGLDEGSDGSDEDAQQQRRQPKRLRAGSPSIDNAEEAEASLLEIEVGARPPQRPVPGLLACRGCRRLQGTQPARPLQA